MGLSDGPSGKNPTCQYRRHKRRGFDPWIRKVPWRRAWQPTPVFFPGESYITSSRLIYFITGDLYLLTPFPIFPNPSPLPEATAALFSVSVYFFFLFLIPDTSKIKWYLSFSVKHFT